MRSSYDVRIHMVTVDFFYATLRSASVVYSKRSFYDKLHLAYAWDLVIRKMSEYPIDSFVFSGK